MAYTPDANDLAEPTSGRPAGTAAAEFRALKAKIASIVAGAVLVGAANYAGPSGLVDFLHIDSRYSHRDLAADGWHPAFFNQQWGGSPHYYELIDSATGTPIKFEAATGFIDHQESVVFGNVAGAGYGRGNGFKVSKNTTIKAIWVKLGTSGNPTDNVELKIWQDVAGVPGGAVIANGTANTINGRRITSTNDGNFWYRFTFATPPAVVANTQYHWVVDRSGAADAVNYYNTARVSTTSIYPHGLGSNQTNADVFASEPLSDHLFLVELADVDQSITTGGVFNDGKYTFFEGNPLNQSNARCKDLKDFKGFTVQDFTLALYGASWTKDKTILDITYGLDHDRIVLRCNAATGFPALTIYEKDGTVATVTGTTDISTATNRLIGIRVRAKNDGADTIQVWVNGTKEAELTAQSYDFDELFAQSRIGTFWLGGGWALASAFTWTKKWDMTLLPSADGATFTTTTASVEANIFSVASGQLNQLKAGMAAGGNGYYLKAAAGFSNANGWTAIAKRRVLSDNNTKDESCVRLSVADGTKLGVVDSHEYFTKCTMAGIDHYVQEDNKSLSNIVLMSAKGSDKYTFTNGKFISDATGGFTAASGNNEIAFGDISVTANENADVIWDYVGYYNTAWVLPQITAGALSEFMLWQGDKTALFATLYNAGVLLSGKQILGIKGNRLIENDVPQKLTQVGITISPSTVSTTGVRLAEMDVYVVGNYIKIEYNALLSNAAATHSYITGPFLDGSYFHGTANDFYGGTSGAAGNQVSASNVTQKQTLFGLHKVAGSFLCAAGTVTNLDRHRHLLVEARTQ